MRDGEPESPFTTWSQGDVLPAEDVLPHLDASHAAIISRTCNIHRTREHLPTIHVAPLVRLPDEAMAEAARNGRRPRYLWVPDYEDGEWFADLAWVTAVDKNSLLPLNPVRGCESAEAARIFRRGAGRFLSKPSTDDDIQASLAPLLKRFKNKHSGQGDEARAMRQVLDVRLEADDWDAGQTEITVVFIVEPTALVLDADELPTPNTDIATGLANGRVGPADIATALADSPSPAEQAWLWDRLAEAWLGICEEGGKVAALIPEVVTEDMYPLSRVRTSDPFDAEDLSYRFAM